MTSALDRLTDPAYNLPAFGNVVSKTTTVVTRATTRLQIKPEEAALREIFGEDFDVYARQVRRWI